MLLKVSLCLLLLVSCSKKDGPDEVFRNFIGENKNAPTRQEMIDLSTGKMKEYLTNLSDEDFKSTLGKDFAQNAKIKIKNRNCDEGKCTYTYAASYESSQNGQKTFDIESKKTAYIVKIDENWKIENIETIKTYYQGQEIK